MDKKTGKIMKLSKYSYGLVIPKDFVKKLRWKEKQKIVIGLRKSSVLITDWKEK